MMHGPEKSDPVIVATKLANKAERSAAEPVERRAGTKGNASQQSTSRTQSRTSVSQALERIRKVASERKKERFTALFHHINTELLEEAFFELSQNDWLPKPIILHPWPSDRFAVTHPRWEPYAGKPLVRFCAGGRAMKRASLPRLLAL
jgi:transcriptional regulator of met regulon